MERRLNPRISSHTRVKLYFNGSGRVQAHLHDFSQGGVAIILDTDSSIPADDDVIYMLADNMDEAYIMKLLRCQRRHWVLGFAD